VRNLYGPDVFGFEAMPPHPVNPLDIITAIRQHNAIQMVIGSFKAHVEATADIAAKKLFDISVGKGDRLPDIAKNPVGNDAGCGHHLQRHKATEVPHYHLTLAS
jgi:hypothetical protein